MIFFTADLHFFHKNIIQYCNRPFSSVEEMNAALIDNWNSTVSKTDVVYIIGDFSFGSKEDTSYIINNLNGSKNLILGNHDKNIDQKKFGMVKQYFELNVQGYPTIILNHYAQRTWNKAYHGSWHLFGHSHGKLEPMGKSVDIGVDSTFVTGKKEYRPFSIEEVSNFMKTVL